MDASTALIWRHCSTSVAAPVVEAHGCAAPPGRHTTDATDQSRLTSPKRAAALAFRKPATLPGCVTMLRFIAHDVAQRGSGHGGSPFCVAHEGTGWKGGGGGGDGVGEGDGLGTCAPPGARSHAASTATVFTTPSQGSGVARPTATVHAALPTHAAAAAAAKPARSQAPRAQAPQPRERSGVP